MKSQSHKAFVAYSLPCDESFTYAAIGHSDVLTANSDIKDYDFVFAPFDSARHNSFGFRFGEVTSEASFEVQIKDKLERSVISYEDYIDDCERLISDIAKGLADKVVLSRIKKVEGLDASVEDLYKEMVRLYPSAFVYLLVDPDIGVWMGATPEKLISENGGKAQTMALAGTQPYSAYEESKWTEKEKEEHAYVEQCIAEELKKHDIPFSKSKRETVRAGQVCHLRSEFVFDSGDLSLLLKSLHPSPAIGTYPKAVAYDLIPNYESHDRRYYCGYLGPVNKDSANLFVNLRCMELDQNAAYLYLGGGITKDSNATKEWEETELKAQTLTRVLNKTTVE